MCNFGSFGEISNYSDLLFKQNFNFCIILGILGQAPFAEFWGYLGFHFVDLELHFGSLGVPEGSILRALGVSLGSILVAF